MRNMGEISPDEVRFASHNPSWGCVTPNSATDESEPSFLITPHGDA